MSALAGPGKPGQPEVGIAADSYFELNWERPQPYEGHDIVGYIVQMFNATSEQWDDVHHALVDPEAPTINKLVTSYKFKMGFQFQFRVVAYSIVGPSEPSDVTCIFIEDTLESGRNNHFFSNL